MKKVFLTLAMLLFAFVGTMKAGVDVEVGMASTTNSYIPTYTYYDYSITQQIYTAAEIGMGGTINAISFEMVSGDDRTRNVNVYMKHVTASAFTSNSDWEAFTETDVLFTGNVTYSTGWVTLTLDTPFDYNGVDNLLICVQDATGDWDSAPSFRAYSYTGGALYAYRDGTPYDITSLSGGYVMGYKNYIKLNMELGPASVATAPVSLGNRPNGYWMAPVSYQLNNTGNDATVTLIETSTDYFTVDTEVPFALNFGEPAEITISTGTAPAGPVNGQIMVVYSENRAFSLIDVDAVAYDAVEPDVFELAKEVTTFPFSEATTTANLYANYALPGLDVTAHKDAVYKVTFDEDVLFSAGTNGANGIAYMYNEDFDGEDGPGHDNYYTYTGPEVLPGPINTWFSYSYTGTNTWYGTSAGGGMIFGYQIPASILQANGYGNCSLVTVETAARSNSGVAYPYDLYVLRGADPANAELVYYQEMDYTPEPGYFFSVNLDEPVLLGDQDNIWVMFYTESPYAAYCGRNPVDPDNGKIWYTTNGTTWYTSTSYTPMIYCRLMELPTRREVVMNLADMSIKEVNGNGQMAESNAEVKGISRAQRFNEMKAQNSRGNRVTETLTVFDGTATDNHVPAYVFYFDDFTKSQHVIPAAELTAMNGGTINSIQYYFNNGIDYTTASTVDVYLTEVTDATISSFVDKSSATVVYTGTLTFNQTSGDCVINFTTPYVYHGGNLLVGIENTTDADYKNIGFYGESGHTGAAVYGSNSSSLASVTPTASNFLPKTTFTYEAASSGGSTDPVYQIADMYVPAGTYYVAVASIDADFQVDMKTDVCPAPDQPIVIDPYDGQTGVDNPYLLQWILGDYTTEMQVLVGTQFPPEDVLIDWTDQLVESVFLTNLQHNKTYFVQVNAKNAAGTTSSDIIGFTTVIDPVEGFTVANDKLHPGDVAEFSWDASVRTLKGYNLYQDGVKVNDTPITETEYTVDGLAHNVTTGYTFNVTAVYDEGESVYSDPIVVYMAGWGTVEGTVYEQDGTTTIAGATVSLRGTDEYNLQSVFTTTAADDGTYSVDVYVGNYYAYATKDGYQECAHDGNVVVDFETVTPDIDILVYEYYFPLGQVRATEQVEENNVLVEWDWNPAELIVDFETGDFSQAEFTLPSSYPWAVTTTNPHEGTYCMKSTCEGIANGSSTIECTVDVPYDGLMGFYVSTSSETNYDKFHFYIDGTEMGSAISGATNYAYKEFAVSEGTHTYKWEYQKDGSVNSNSDCVYVDDIALYKQAEPIPGGGVNYDFDNGTMMGWTTIDADGDGYNWQMASVVMSSQPGHSGSADFVFSQSYDNSYGVLYPDNYLVSPAKLTVQDGAFISFWACAQDASYAAEKFGVAISTGSNTNASDFTTIQNWTMTAKGVNTADERGLIRGTKAQGSWYQYTVDLSSYAGQEIWVAIRHYNCSDMFYLDVDDVMLADGSAKFTPNNNRSLTNYNLYRRNINLPEPWTADLIASPASDVYEYIDNDWANLPYGVYQWGIQACYAGNAPTDRAANEQATFGFEGGLEGWTVLTVNTGEGEWLHSDNNPGGYDYTTHAHGGTGFAMCYSYVDYVGAYNTDSYLISPQKYSIGAGSSVTFWADNANDSYPENISVCVATTATPTASDFTAVWTGGAKGTGKNAEVRHKNDRYDNWRYHTVDLSAYAGQEVWIAFHDVNYDAYEIWIDDVTINYEGAIVPPTPSIGDGLSEIIWSNIIEKDMYSDVTVNVTLNNGQPATGVSVVLDGAEEDYNHTMDETGTYVFEGVRKGDYDVTVTLEGFADFFAVATIDDDEETIDVMLYEAINPIENLYVSPTGWAMWDGPMPGGSGNGGNGGSTTGDEFSEDFENGAIPSGWTSLDADGDGRGWRMISEFSGVGHNGSSDGMFSQSYDNNYGVLYPDNYLITNQVTVGSTSVFSFWACAQDASYAAEHFGVAISTTGTAAADFTMLEEWTMTAKNDGTAKGPRGTNAQGTWYQKSVNLSAYAGQQVYLAIRHFNCSDMFYLDIDDVALANTATKDDRAPILYKVMLDDVYVGESKYAYFQHDVEELEEGSTHTTKVMPIYATGQGPWAAYTWEYSACSNYTGATDVTAAQAGINVNVNFTLPEGSGSGGGGGGTPGEGQWYYYDDGTYASSIGTGGGVFYWGIMIPAGSYTGTFVTKVAAYTERAMTGTATIYNDGTTAPATAVGTTNVTFTASNDFTEFVFADPIAVDPTKNIWVVFANNSGADYPAACSNNTGDANGRWVSLDGTTWEDLTSYSLNYTFMVRAYIAESTKADAVVEIVDPMQPISNPGTLSEAPMGLRAQWDVLKTFNGTSGYQYGVCTDGTNIYTSSWSASSTSMFYKYDMDGNFIEEFNISGSGQIRDLTYDGTYFYGVANASTVYCLDLANHTLVSSFTSSYGAMRGITYDPTNDGFWVIGNWSGNLTLIDRTGAVQFTGPTPTSASGLAYYKDDANVEHVFYCNNGTNEIYDYNIGTNTMSSAPVFDLELNVPGWTGSTGGCHVGVYDGKTCFYADAQQSPQLIAILELSASAPLPPVPPVSGDVLGAMIFRDGELITGAPVTTSPFVDTDAPAGEHEYCVRVVYDDWSMSCPVCVDADYECVPVINLVGEYVYNDELDFGANLTWECELAEFVVEYDIYFCDTIAMRVTDGSTEAYLNIAQHTGTYTFGVVAVYPNCESEMVSVDITVTDVNEANINARIYPNPTHNNVTIEAKAMNHITVVNALGQVVYDADVNADMTQLNLGQFNAGVYMIRINTENGDSVKRVTVVK